MFFNVRNNKSYSRNVFTTRLKAGVDAVAVTSIGKHKLKNKVFGSELPQSSNATKKTKGWRSPADADRNLRHTQINKSTNELCDRNSRSERRRGRHPLQRATLTAQLGQKGRRGTVFTETKHRQS